VNARQWVVVGAVLAVIGGVLAFALENKDASALGVSLRPFGGVLLVVGVLLLGAVAIAGMHGGSADPSQQAADKGSGGGEFENIKAIGGLIAVVAGITAVAILAVIAVTRLGSDKSSTVAVTSSAFGVISAVVGAYLGIKISSETNAKAGDEANAKASKEAKNAAVAQHVAHITSSELEAVKATASDLVTPEQAAKIKAARIAAGEEAARSMGPHPGGGSA
jgi:hypothetical protein